MDVDAIKQRLNQLAAKRLANYCGAYDLFKQDRYGPLASARSAISSIGIEYRIAMDASLLASDFLNPTRFYEEVDKRLIAFIDEWEQKNRGRILALQPNCAPLPLNLPHAIGALALKAQEQMPSIATGSYPRRDSAQSKQDQEVIEAIKKLGYDPSKLPKRKPGKPWVKSEVRNRLKWRQTIFDKAWDRLRSSKEIAED